MVLLRDVVGYMLGFVLTLHIFIMCSCELYGRRPTADDLSAFASVSVPTSSENDEEQINPVTKSIPTSSDTLLLGECGNYPKQDLPAKTVSVSDDWKVTTTEKFVADASYVKSIILAGEPDQEERIAFSRLFADQKSWFDTTMSSTQYFFDPSYNTLMSKREALARLAQATQRADILLGKKLSSMTYTRAMLDKLKVVILYELNTALHARKSVRTQLSDLEIDLLIDRVLHAAGITLQLSPTPSEMPKLFVSEQTIKNFKQEVPDDVSLSSHVSASEFGTLAENAVNDTSSAYNTALENLTKRIVELERELYALRQQNKKSVDTSSSGNNQKLVALLENAEQRVVDACLAQAKAEEHTTLVSSKHRRKDRKRFRKYGLRLEAEREKTLGYQIRLERAHEKVKRLHRNINQLIEANNQSQHRTIELVEAKVQLEQKCAALRRKVMLLTQRITNQRAQLALRLEEKNKDNIRMRLELERALQDARHSGLTSY